MMKRIVLLCLAMAAVVITNAQTEVLEIDVPPDSAEESRFGENRRHFVHLYGESGLIADLIERSGNYNFPRSFQLGFGVQYKLKITSWLATGAEITFESYRYRMDQDRTNAFPDTVLHDKDLVMQSLFMGSYYIRFNMDQRGNTVGKYFDMGIGGGWQIGSRYSYEDELQDDQVKEVTIKRYNATLADSWYLFGRLGVNNLALFGKYRMDKLFKSEKNFPEIPPLTIGLRLGFH